MTTYRELLLDPRWQRKRLEVLESAGWACETCGDTETTLHVHHMRYVKGRKPWEYERQELKSLCAYCHEEYHRSRSLLDELLAAANPVQFDEIVAMVGGYLSASLDTTAAQEKAAKRLDPLAFNAGHIAQVAVGGQAFQRELAMLIRNYFPPQCFNPAQAQVLDALVAVDPAKED